MEIKVVCPSHKRGKELKPASVIKNLIICIPESQYSDYKHWQLSPYNCTILCHPDDIIGLPLKRQWIYEQLGNVFMVDDDVDAVLRKYTSRGEEQFIRDKELVYEIIQKTGNDAREAGCYLFSFSHTPRPNAYESWNPIKLKGFVTGCVTGILKGSKLSWNNCEAKCAEDYYISLLNAYHHRKCWIDTRFYFRQLGTFVNRGGQAEHRSLEQEEADYNFLKDNFGDAILLKSESNRASPLRRVKHRYEKSLKLPF